MRAFIPVILVLILFSSCTHKITRSGYAAPSNKYSNCDIVIKKKIKPNAEISQKIGSIRLGDTGFSTTCTEADALRIMRNEGCAINADLIVITNEMRADLGSSCYRCSAEFYTIDEELKEHFENDENMEVKQVYNRVKEDKKRNGAMLAGSIIGGLIFGLIFAL